MQPSLPPRAHIHLNTHVLQNERRVLRELETGIVSMLAALGADTPQEEQEQALAAILKHQTDTAKAAEAAVVAAAARAARSSGKKGGKGKKGKKGGKGGSSAAAPAAATAAAAAPVDSAEAEEEEAEEVSTPSATEGDDVVVDVAALLAEAVEGGTDVDTASLESTLQAQHGNVSLSRLTAIAVLKCSERFILRNQLFFVRDTKAKLEAWAESQGFPAETDEERAAAEHALVAAPEGEGEEAPAEEEGGDSKEEGGEAAVEGAPGGVAEDAPKETQ